jgi:hypothetical protein
MAVQRVLLSICLAAIVEAILVVCLLATDWAGPITVLRPIVAYTQAPSDLVLRLAAHYFLLSPAAVPLIFAIAFLAQTALFALPIWRLLRRIPGGWPRSA